MAVSALSLYGAKRLHIDTDLTALLPNTVHSVQDLEVLDERFGGVGYVSVVAQSRSTEGLMAFADHAAQVLSGFDGVRYVEHRRNIDYFKDRALYFFDEADLQSMEQRLADRVAWERNRRNPLYLDLEDDDAPPSLDFNDILKQYADQGGVHQFIHAGPQAVSPESDYYLDAKSGMVVVLVKPDFKSTDLRRTTELVNQVRKWGATLEKSQFADDLSVQTSGRYSKRVDEQAQMQIDLRRSSLLALVLVVLYLLLHFRRGFAVVLMMVPLLLGLVWTFGFAGLTFASLNILTALIGAILLGLGIDHGIHFLGRFQAEYASEQSLEQVIATTFGKTGRAVVTAAVTTTVAFAGLAFSEFRAFHEFGAIAAAGMVLLVLAYVVALPALITLAVRFGWQPSGFQARRLSGFGDWVTQHGGKALAASAFVALVLMCGIPFAKFDYNFYSLQTNDLPVYKLDHKVNQIIGYPQSPIVVLVENAAEERHVVKALRERKQALGDESSVRFAVGIQDLVPERQEEKRPLLRQISHHLERASETWIDKSERALFRQLKRAAKAEPVTAAAIPEQVTRRFLSPDPQDQGGFVLVYAYTHQEDGLEITSLAHEIRGVSLPDGSRIVAAGETMVLADILEMVWAEAPPVLISIIVAVFCVVWLLLGNLRVVLLSLMPAALTLLVLVGLLPYTHQTLNYLNIVVIPVLFGVGVDGGIHMMTRINAGVPFASVLSETGRAIAGAILTTGLGFGSMLLATQPGLFSLGSVAVLGLAVNLLACLVVLPASVAWWQGRQRQERSMPAAQGAESFSSQA